MDLFCSQARATAKILLANVRLPQLPRSRPAEGHVGTDFGGIAAEISTNMFRMERAKPAILHLARSGIAQGNCKVQGFALETEKMYRFLAAMPPKTYTFSLWRGKAAPHAAAKGDFAVALWHSRVGCRRLIEMR
jgi:hypothetical protein